MNCAKSDADECVAVFLFSWKSGIKSVSLPWISGVIMVVLSWKNGNRCFRRLR